MDKTYIIKIFGQVQGIGYKKFVYDLANNRGITGRIKDKSDGSILILASTDESRIDEFIKELSINELYSGISCVRVQETTGTVFDGFHMYN